MYRDSYGFLGPYFFQGRHRKRNAAPLCTTARLSDMGRTGAEYKRIKLSWVGGIAERNKILCIWNVKAIHEIRLSGLKLLPAKATSVWQHCGLGRLAMQQLRESLSRSTPSLMLG